MADCLLIPLIIEPRVGNASAYERPAIVIRGVGLATSQGNGQDLLARDDLTRPIPTPWPPVPRSASTLHRPARSLHDGRTGPTRLTFLARQALDECFGGGTIPSAVTILLASCNGNAAASDLDLWRMGFELGLDLFGRSLPVASAACASGLHALFLGTRLVHAGAEEVVVLAVDIDSAPAHASFEALRILADPDAETPPWHPGRAGFILGEAAVAIRIGPASSADAEAPRLSELSLGYDLPGDDGLVRALASLEPAAPALVLGQGTGPAPVDRSELAAIASRVPREVPLATPLDHFGHTLGASGLLSVALAALAYRAPIANALVMGADFAPDGRPLVGGAVSSRETVVVCRALGGACVACTVGLARSATRPPSRWRQAALPPPLRDPNLRRLAKSALAHRPATPPDLLLVRLEVPLAPPPDARIAGRLLPSSILEMTPGFVAQLVAQTWGFAGPAVCLVASERAESEVTDIIHACTMAGDDVYRVDVQGQGEDRHVVWNR